MEGANLALSLSGKFVLCQPNDNLQSFLTIVNLVVLVLKEARGKVKQNGKRERERVKMIRKVEKEHQADSIDSFVS